jgi:tRNA G10  N-methylase Trm11
MAQAQIAISKAGSSAVKENNKVLDQDQSIHNWYRFILSFPPHLVRTYLERFGIGPDQTVLDPFCGTGTTIVECKKLGIPSVGVEANAVACFATDVKLNWRIDPDSLLDHAHKVADLTLKRLRTQGIEETPGLPLFRQKPKALPKLRTLEPETLKLLLKNSISPLPLHRSLELLDSLEERHNAELVGHERLALAKALVFGISNLEFGPEVGVGPAKSDAPVVYLWLQEIEEMADHLRRFRSKNITSARVLRADARSLDGVLMPHSIDAVITSPPYPNEKDYTRTTRLESVLLGFIHTKEDLRALKRTFVRSNTRSVYKSDCDDLEIVDNAEVDRIADAIERRRIRLGKTSGFERLYARVTKLYFGGMARHLSSLRTVLRPGARLAYVVGDQASYLRIMIRTGQILADIAKSLGYEVLGIDLFRTRLSTATREQLREEVVILRWPGNSKKL